MTTPSDTQSLILSRAATRPGNLAMPLPEGLVGAAAKMVVGKMIARGWLEEVEASSSRSEPMWRETGDGRGTTLIATEAGLEAIGIEPLAASAVASARRAKSKPEPVQMPDDTDTAKPVTIRAGTKQAQIIAMLQRPEGASIAEIVAATSWQAHTARGGHFRGAQEEAGATHRRSEGRGQGHGLQVSVMMRRAQTHRCCGARECRLSSGASHHDGVSQLPPSHSGHRG